MRVYGDIESVRRVPFDFERRANIHGCWLMRQT
jgi:hypothetical protein